MLIHTIGVENLLSFGPAPHALELRPLNVLIGANGAGKSNLLEVFDLLGTAPHGITERLGEGGGAKSWGGTDTGTCARIEATVEPPPDHGAVTAFRYTLTVTGLGSDNPTIGQTIRARDDGEEQPAKPPPTLDADDAAMLASALTTIRVYREDAFAPRRNGSPTDNTRLAGHQLAGDGTDLARIVERLTTCDEAKRELVSALRTVDASVNGYRIGETRGEPQLILETDGGGVPEARISTGTLRYLRLVAVLRALDGERVRLIAIEHPEHGLHPDILPSVADLLRKAATRYSRDRHALVVEI